MPVEWGGEDGEQIGDSRRCRAAKRLLAPFKVKSHELKLEIQRGARRVRKNVWLDG